MTVTGNGGATRTGAQALALLAAPLNSTVLRSLTSGPKRLPELRREAGRPAQSTLRSRLKGLRAIGAIVKHKHSAFPGSLEYELAPVGRELCFVLGALERWLAESPEVPLELDSDAGQAATAALVAGWSSTIVRALAGRHLSLAELDRLIGAFDYPSLERRLTAMRLAGLVESVPAEGEGPPYAPTDWLHLGIAPIVAASRWERRNLPERTARIGRIDAEAALLLTMRLLDLPTEVSGSCRLVVEVPDGDESRPASVTIDVAAGRAVPRPANSPTVDSWAIGPTSAWFRAAIEADPNYLEVGGRSRLIRAVLDGINASLFAPFNRRNRITHQ